MRRAIFPLMTVCALWTSPVAASTEPFGLVRDGKPEARILVGGEQPVVAEAVKDLVDYVEKITGARLEVTHGQIDLPGPTLHIGETNIAASIRHRNDDIRIDGFVMKRAGHDVLIAGAIPEGTANGVTTLIQEQFGVRWYFPGELWEVVPKRDSLTVTVDANVGDDVRLVNPSFSGRQLWGDPLGKDFMRRMRMTQKGVALPYVGAGHSINAIVNPQKFGHKPEYFAWFDGKHHVEHDAHPCFTHPDMFEIFMEYVRQGGSSMGVNDNLTACRCERCLKLDGNSEPYMGMTNISESFFQLIQKVAAQSYRENPTHRIGVFAYQLTNAPPATVDHLGPNVSVVLCQDTAQYFDDNVKRIDQSMSAEWVTKCDHIRFYDYIGLSHWTPRYFPHLVADQMKHLAKIGLEGYGTHSDTMTDSAMPMFYLLYQVLWDADLDPDRLLDDMMTDLYAESAGPVGRFYEHWEAIWMRQEQGRWLNAIDNLRGEMALFTMDDFITGRRLLEEAASLAKDERVTQRIDFLRAFNDFSYAAAETYFITMKVLQACPETPAEAERLSAEALDSWVAFSEAYDRTDHMPATFLGGWASKTFRVRMWGLKQQVRDAIIAPFIRWSTAHELEIDSGELEDLEQRWHQIARDQLSTAEGLITEKVGAAYRMPRAAGVRATPIPALPRTEEAFTFDVPWPTIASITTCEWVYRDRSPDTQPGKYDEPLIQYYMDPPAPEDHHIAWQAAWTPDALHLRIEVADDVHRQDRAPQDIWEQDSVQIALNEHRDDILYDVHSWTYIWGGYRGTEIEFGLGLKADQTLKHVWHVPEGLSGEEAMRRIQGRVQRAGDKTVYEAVVPWSVLPGFQPEEEKSVGIGLVVNEVDEDDRRVSAEYGSGIVRAKRPGDFAAVRLAGPEARRIDRESAQRP
jgi:hypothetical protein